jgi:hypothetical protein
MAGWFQTVQTVRILAWTILLLIIKSNLIRHLNRNEFLYIGDILAAPNLKANGSSLGVLFCIINHFQN